MYYTYVPIWSFLIYGVDKATGCDMGCDDVLVNRQWWRNGGLRCGWETRLERGDSGD